MIRVTLGDKQTFIRNNSVDESKIDWTVHAIEEAFHDGFQQEEVERGLHEAEIIEDYPIRGRRLPDCLILGFTPAGRAFHCVVAIDEDNDRLILVTVYEPDAGAWKSDFKTRKK